MKYQILQGDNRDTLKTLADNSIDAIVTDPPYGIDFLGKSWDANTGALETYQECLRVLKPGGHILAFSAARTYHYLAVTLEQAGFEIRDQIMWIYSSGFPKSQDVGRQLHKKEHGKPDKQRFDPAIMIKVDGDRYRHPDTNKLYRALPDINGDRLAVAHEGEKYGTVYEEVIVVDNEWSGWGSALKPAHEPIALARKPMKGSIRENVIKHGTGAINIDATRVPYADEKDKASIDHKMPTAAWSGHTLQVDSYEKGEFVKVETNELGRFPSNVIGEILQADYQKYFYCPKVSRKERHIGYDLNKVPTIEHNDPSTIHLHPLWTPAIGKNVYRLKQAIEEHNAKVPPTDSSGYQGLSNGGNYLEKKQAIVTEASMLSDMGGYYVDENNNETKLTGKNIWLPQTGRIYIHGLKEEYRKWCEANNKTPSVGNNHPTVKPIELMKYLIKLITPPGGIVLDPFNGSGSTGCAATELGFEYIGCELDPAYVTITHKRIEAWNNHSPVEPKGIAAGHSSQQQSSSPFDNLFE